MTQDIPFSQRKAVFVDENNNEIGLCGLIEAHLGDGKLHRASSVFLFNKEGKLLIQKRSNKKFVGALQWANTCCGNVRPNESFLDCAYRRLQFELGISPIPLKQLTSFSYKVKCNETFSENEYDTMFVGFYEGNVTVHPDEVVETKWVSYSELLSEIEKNRSSFAPWFLVFLQRNDVQEMMNNPKKYVTSE